jgi:hypothetical protein
MIHDLSQTLRKFLDDPNLPEPLKSAQIVFDRPAEQFNPAQTTVDLFLYDIRENVELRSNEPTVERQNGLVVTRRPPLRVACSYVVTAWPVGGTELALQEHQLLSQVLQIIARHPTVPLSFLQGSLVEQDFPLPMLTAQTDGLKNPSEFWTALGNKLRPSLTVTVTIAIKDLFEPEAAPAVIAQDVRLGKRTKPDEEEIEPATREQVFRIGGRITDAEDAPLEGAFVTLVELHLAAKTDAAGRYRLGRIPSSGAYTLRVQSGSAVKERTITIPAPAGDNYDVQLTQ